MSEEKCAKIAKQARSYQTLIIEHGIKENSIVYLPTGSGKTFIATQIIRHFSKDLERLISEGGKRTAFLVNTNALAQQQREYLKDELPFEVGIFTGEQNVDYWDKDDWDSNLGKYQILVATTQVILDAVCKNFMGIRDFNVMVFDECHHARKDHPMHELMKHFADVPVKEQPRVIGLSGMLIAASIRPDLVVEEINRLESTFLSKIVTVNNIDEHKNVLLYSTKPKEACVLYDALQNSEFNVINFFEDRVNDIQTKLKQMTLDEVQAQNPRTLRNTIPKPIKFMVNMFEDFKIETMDMGLYASFLSLLCLTIHFELKKKSAETGQLRTLYSYCISECELMKKFLHVIMKMDVLNSAKILTFSSEKVRKLIQLLKDKFQDKSELQCLVFVKRKYTAKVLYHLLKEYALHDSDFPIVPDFMVGNTGELPESIEAILSASQNKQAVNNFRSYKTNCLISTSVLEEGIDIQSVNLVIMYDYPQTFRSYVQSKGRARSEESDYYVFIENVLKLKFDKSYITYQHIDSNLKKILIEKVIDKLEVNEETIAQEQEYKIQPFITKGGAKLTAGAAISLISHYAALLPNDIFTNVNLQYRRNDLKDGRVSVSLRLPIQSKINCTIQSDAFENVRLAKQHAAFLACKALYESGELNEKLIPIEANEKIENYNVDYFSHWHKYEVMNDNAKKDAGVSKRRTHEIATPSQVKDCAPAVGKICYIYRIKVVPNFTADTDELKVFHQMYASQSSYGIMTNKPLPKLCSFKLFQSYGEIEVEIESEPIMSTVRSKDHLESLQKFHVMLFRDLLRTWKNFLVLDNSSYIIVPLKQILEMSLNVSNLNDSPSQKVWDIDWNLVQKFQSLDEPKLNQTEKPQIEKFKHKVIQPIYKGFYGSNICNYVVTNVLEHMTPLSPFPSEDKAKNFKEYFEKNYSKTKIRYNDQFLVEVRGIANNLNLLFPGGGVKGRSKRIEKDRMSEILVPEICHTYNFPGDYWLKATLLPSVIHRMHYLLLAENLRMYLLHEVGIGNSRIPQIYKLDVNFKDEVEETHVEHEYGKFPQIQEKLKALLGQTGKVEIRKKVRETEKPSVFEGSADRLPIDIDRNWTKIQPIDLDHYLRFVTKNDDFVLTPSMKRLGLESNPNNRYPALTYNGNNQNSIKLLSVKNTVQQKDLIKALTTAKSGDIFDMERFEVLGDSFLKFAVSLFLYLKHDNWHEGYLTQMKGKIVSNRNLFYCSNDIGLPQMIKFHGFSPRGEWLPPSTKIPEKICELVQRNKTTLSTLLDLDVEISDEEFRTGQLKLDNFNKLQRKIQQTKMDDERLQIGTSEKNVEDNTDNGVLSFMKAQHFKDKVVADITESLIGCCVQAVGMQESIKLLEHLSILPKNCNFEILMRQPILARKFKKATDTDILKMLPNYLKLEGILGYTFKDRSFLLNAITHASFPMNAITGCYQELEFVGDAILDWLITSYIYENCPDLDPGQLTDLRSALVNNVTLGCIVVQHGIEKFLLSQNHLLSNIIKGFVNYQNAHNHEITDQIDLMETDGDLEAATADCIEVPKVLGDIFESIVGAIYFDSGNDLNKTWGVIYRLMQPVLIKFMKDVPKQIVRKLYEYPKAEPRFFNAETVEDKVAVPLTFKMKGCPDAQLVIGFGQNKKSAKKAAAKLALRKLTENQMET